MNIVLLFLIVPTDAISSLGSGVLIKYLSYSTSKSKAYTISCDFYPVILFANSNASWYINAYSIRPYTTINLYAANTSAKYESDVTWGDISVTIGTPSYFDYYAVIGIPSST